jgi:replicative DNA helicase
MANLQIPSHLILTQKQKEKLHSLPISEFTDVKWASQNSAISFLKEHNLVLEDIQPENKWKIRCSIKLKEFIFYNVVVEVT